MSSFLDRVKAEMFEEDTPTTKPVAAPAPVVAVSPAPVAYPTGQIYMSTPTSGSVASVDPEALSLINNEVMVETINGHPSAYMKFMKFWDALNRPQDISVVLNVMKVSDPVVTFEAIGADLTEHLKLLDKTVAEANAEIDKADNAATNEVQSKIASLNSLNEQAAAEIARHQSETLTRSSELASLQDQQNTMKSKFNTARQRTTMAQASVRADLEKLAATFNVKG